jgi:hypothetical protein
MSTEMQHVWAVQSKSRTCASQFVTSHRECSSTISLSRSNESPTASASNFSCVHMLCVCLCVSACVRACVRGVCACACACACVCICMCICMYVCMYVCMYICLHGAYTWYQYQGIAIHTFTYGDIYTRHIYIYIPCIHTYCSSHPYKSSALLQCVLHIH